MVIDPITVFPAFPPRLPGHREFGSVTACDGGHYEVKVASSLSSSRLSATPVIPFLPLFRGLGLEHF